MKEIVNKAEWPQNLIFAIFGRDSLEDCRVAEDWMGSLEYILMELIPDDEERALRYRYQEGLSYKEVGEKVGSDRNKAKQKIAWGIRRIRHPRRAKYLLNGVEEIYTERYEYVRESRFNEGYWIGFKHGALGEMAPEFTNPYREHNDLTKMPIMMASVSYLQLSTRLHNGLMRANIKTIGELLTKSRRDILKIRNVGRRSVDELEEKLMQHRLFLCR